MLIYRFRINFEDSDEFLREIDIRSDQTFDVFYKALVDDLKLDSETLSSFFICDYRYRKKLEISLVDMNTESEGEGGKKVFVMNQAKLSDFIDDPHQKLLLEYDYLNIWTFYIELFKIFPSNPQHEYPRFHKREGEKPRELTKVSNDIIPEEDSGLDLDLEQDEIYDPEDLERFDEADEFMIDDTNRGGLEDDTP